MVVAHAVERMLRVGALEQIAASHRARQATRELLVVVQEKLAVERAAAARVQMLEEQLEEVVASAEAAEETWSTRQAAQRRSAETLTRQLASRVAELERMLAEHESMARAWHGALSVFQARDERGHGSGQGGPPPRGGGATSHLGLSRRPPPRAAVPPSVPPPFEPPPRAAVPSPLERHDEHAQAGAGWLVGRVGHGGAFAAWAPSEEPQEGRAEGAAVAGRAGRDRESAVRGGRSPRALTPGATADPGGVVSWGSQLAGRRRTVVSEE